MIYRKPKNVTLTDMCIYIDKTAYTEEHDAQTIYEYLYFLVRHFAMKERWFRRIEYYDDFAIFGATRVYMRLVNEKQFQENSKLKPIKSILNYLKSTVYPMKVDFEQSTYFQTITCSEKEDYIQYNFDNIISSCKDFVNSTAFDLMLEGIGPICNECIECIPYSFDKVIKYNIITSVKLTLLNQLTLTDYSKRYLQRLISNNRLNDVNIEEAFDYIKDEVKLYHLDNSFQDLILVIVRKLKSKIARELSELVSSNYVDTTLIDNIVYTYKKEVERTDDEYEFRT